jgi:hypothetical protein
MLPRYSLHSCTIGCARTEASSDKQDGMGCKGKSYCPRPPSISPDRRVVGKQETESLGPIASGLLVT